MLPKWVGAPIGKCTNRRLGAQFSPVAGATPRGEMAGVTTLQSGLHCDEDLLAHVGLEDRLAQPDGGRCEVEDVVVAGGADVGELLVNRLHQLRSLISTELSKCSGEQFTGDYRLHARLEPARKDGEAMAELMDRITADPEQCGGRPCIRGMRIRVSDVLDLLANGLSPEDIVEEMPDLELEDVRASLRFASRRLDHPVVAA